MKKKLLTVLLIVVLVFNFICTSPAYADPDDETGIPTSNGEGQITPEQAENLTNDGTPSNGQSVSVTDVVLGTIFQTISLMLNSFPMAVHVVLNMITANPTAPQSTWDISDVNFSSMKWEINWDWELDTSKFFTIQRTVFNEVALFNIDVFNQEDAYTVGSGAHEETIYQAYPILTLKESTAGWFYSIRLLAMMINLIVLIYVGIRMAMSTVASDEAKYKKMLISWAESMLILFFLHYIMNFAIGLGELVLNIIYNLREGMTDAEGFENVIVNKVYNCIIEESGMQVFMYSCFYWVLIFLQIKFFLTYLKRVLAVMFLTIIAPFITVTYPIDKMGDGRAQAFDAWFKEYLLNVSIQPIHAAIYLIFVFSAGEIAEKSPIVAMIFLLTLGRIEKIVRNIFGISDSISVKNFADEMKKGKKGK